MQWREKSRLPSNPVGLLGLVGALALALLLLAPSSVAKAQQDPDLEQAIADYLQQQGETYAGPCEDTSPPAHIGMWCAEVQSLTERIAIVDLGPAFSEFDVRVTFEQRDGEWRFVGEEVIPPPGEPEGRRYAVQSGDTLFSLANRFGTTVQAIAEANDIEDPTRISAGQVLAIPEVERTYTVQAGDTLFSIANRFGTTIEAIAEANDIEDPTRIAAGQVLVLPNDNGGGEPEPVTACLRGGGFAEDGDLGSFGSATGDGVQVEEFRFGQNDECERLVIDLATQDGAEATTARPLSAEFVREHAIVRLHLDDEFGLDELVDWETDAELDGRWLERAYVVRTLDGGIFIDVHLGSEGVLARAFTLDSPARIVVDVRPGGDDLENRPAAGNLVVVVEPHDTGEETYPLTIRGYTRQFEANVIARIRTNTDVEAENFTTAASWAETWGEYELTIDEGPLGDIELFVGEDPARGGPEEGVYIDLTMVNEGEVFYPVQPGDNLFRIALRFGTTVEAIAEANGIEDPAAIEAGQVLVIPR